MTTLTKNQQIALDKAKKQLDEIYATEAQNQSNQDRGMFIASKPASSRFARRNDTYLYTADLYVTLM